MKLAIAIPTCAMFSVLASMATAEKISLAKIFDEIPGFVREGVVAGMEAWRSPASGEIWFIAPDGESVVAGRIVAIPKSVDSARGPKEFSSRFRNRDFVGRSENYGDGASSWCGLYENNVEEMTAGPNEDALRPSSSLGSGGCCENFSFEGNFPSRIPKRSKIRDAIGATGAVEAEPEQSKSLDALGRKAFWFGVGKPNSQPVYAVVDPVCPYSAEAMLRFKEQVESGLLHLRVVLIATARRHSNDAIASILVQPDPPAAFWEHAISFALRGYSSLQIDDKAVLPAEIAAALRANIELASELEIPGVPFLRLALPGQFHIRRRGPISINSRGAIGE